MSNWLLCWKRIGTDLEQQSGEATDGCICHRVGAGWSLSWADGAGQEEACLPKNRVVPVTSAVKCFSVKMGTGVRPAT